MTASEVAIEIPDENFQRRSVADFFHDNKAIAGFDNSMRVVFTSVRELVENGLDAAEKILKLPSLDVKIELLSSQEIASLLEIEKYSKKDKGHQDFIRLTVKDNGSGVPEKEVPDAFGRVLTGSNYGVRQSRGRFGLGAKMVLLNAMATVDLPIVIISRHMKEKVTVEQHLFINLGANEPKLVHKEIYDKKSDKHFKESGTLVSVTFTGSWMLAKRFVKEYFHQLSIITPYSSFEIELPDEKISLPRVIDHLPAYPSTMKIHPKGCDITTLKREIDYTKSKTMIDFLSSHFEGITKKKAKEFLIFINLPDKDPRDLTSADIRRIVHDGFLAQEEEGKIVKRKKGEKRKIFNFTRATGKGLSPLGEDRLRKGLSKELDPFLVEAISRPVNSYSGHAFIIEASIAYGGKILDEEQDESGKSSVRVYRFANRIPLLFGAANDVITKTITDSSMVPWKDYKINLNSSPIAIAVSLVSTKIPFPETSKEYLADVKEIRYEIAEALKSLGVKIRTHLSRRERADRERQRKGRFERFAPVVSDAVLEILEENEEQPYELNNLALLLTRALVEGMPKSAQHRKPPSPSIRAIKYWIDFPENRRDQLLEKDVLTLADFLATPDKDLVLKSLPIERVREIKRISIIALDENISTPRISELKLIPDDIENGFTQFEKLSKSLSRRWMTTVYDFFVTKSEDFLKVRGFNEKLWAMYKRQITDKLKRNDELSDDKHNLNSISWMNEDIIEEFNSSSIRSIPEFLLSFPNLLLNVKKFESFHSYLLKFIKKDIKKNIENLADNLNSNMVVWMSGSSKKALNIQKLKTWQDLIDTIDAAPKTILTNTEVLVELINNLKESIIQENIKSNPLMLNEIDLLSRETVIKLKNQKVNTFYEFLSKDQFPDNTLFLEEFNIFRSEKLKKWNTGKVPLVNELIWIPSDLEHQLNKNGIFTIYEFLITPTFKLHRYTKNLVELEIITEIKQQYGIPLNYLDSDLRVKLNSKGIITTEELMHLSTEDLHDFDPKIISEIENIQVILNNPIVSFPELPFTELHSLYHMGLMTVYDFLIWPETELLKIIPPMQMFIIKNKIDLIEIKKLSTKHSKNLSQYGYLDKTAIKILKELDLTKVEDILFKNSFKLEITFQEHKIIEKNRKKYLEALIILRRELQSPIVFLPEFKFTKIREVLSKNIRTIMEFIYWPTEDLESIFDNDVNINQLQNNIPEVRKGIALDSMKFFSTSETSALKNEHIRYVEEIYFTLNRQTFAVPKVDWTRIRDTKALLNLPVGLIVFAESVEAKDEDGNKIKVTIDKPISHTVVNKLNKANIQNILEFLLVPIPHLATALGLSKEDAKNLQKNLKIKSEEEKMELNENILGFPKSFIKDLDSIGVVTLEGLYFVSDEALEENPGLMKSAYAIKRTLQSSLRLFEIFTPEIRQKLGERNIFSLATFLMFPSNEIAKILNITEERVEETFKMDLNVYELNQQLENSLAIITEISSNSIMELREKDVITIGHLLSIPQDKIEDYSDDKNVYKVYHSITPSEIDEYSSKAVTSLEKYFSKAYTRKIVRSGFASLQEIVYFAKETDFPDDDAVWKEVYAIQSVLNINAKYFSPEDIIKNIEKLEELGFMKLIDIIGLRHELLPKGSGISENDLTFLQEQFNISKLIKITKAPINVISAMDTEFKEKLISHSIETIGDLLLQPRAYLGNILEISKKEIENILNELNIPGIQTVLNLSPQFILNMDSSQFLTLSRKRISTLLDILTLEHNTLAEILGLEVDEISNIFNEIDWNEFNSILNSSLYSIYNLPSSWKNSLILNDIKTLNAFIKTSDTKLSGILSYAERTIIASKASLTVKSIKQERETHKSWNEIITGYIEAINLLKTKSKDLIVSIGTTEIEANELIKVIELPISNFASLISENLRQTLEESNILTVLDLISYNVEDLKKIKKLQDEDVKTIYNSIQIKNLLVGFTEPLKVKDFPIITKSMFDKLKKVNLTTVEKLITFFDQTDELPKELEIDLPRVYRTLQHPVILLPDLNIKEKYALLNSGKKNLIDVMRVEIEELATLLDKPTSEITKYLETITLQKLEKERISNGNLITSLNAFPENIISSINNQTKLKDLTFEELFFMQSSISLNKSDQSHVDKLKEAYFAPLVFHNILMEEYPNEFEKISLSGFQHIFSLLVYSGTKLSAQVGIEESITRKLRYNLDFDKVKKYIRKENFIIKDPIPLLKFTTKDIEKTKSLGITSWQNLVYPQLFLYSEQNKKWLIEKQEQFEEIFSMPINRLEGMKLTSIPTLKNAGIINFKLYIFGSSRVIRDITKQSASDYNNIRSNPKVSSKKQMTESLDKILEKARESKKVIIEKSEPIKSPKKSSKKVPAKSSKKKPDPKKPDPKPVNKTPFTPPKRTKKTVTAKAIKPSKKIISKKLVFASKKSSKNVFSKKLSSKKKKTKR